MGFGTVEGSFGGWSFAFLAFLILILLVVGFGFFFYPWSTASGENA
jgi:hypothetical protein